MEFRKHSIVILLIISYSFIISMKYYSDRFILLNSSTILSRSLSGFQIHASRIEDNVIKFQDLNGNVSFVNCEDILFKSKFLDYFLSLIAPETEFDIVFDVKNQIFKMINLYRKYEYYYFPTGSISEAQLENNSSIVETLLLISESINNYPSNSNLNNFEKLKELLSVYLTNRHGFNIILTNKFVFMSTMIMLKLLIWIYINCCKNIK